MGGVFILVGPFDTSLKTAVRVFQDDSVLTGFYYEKHS